MWCITQVRLPCSARCESPAGPCECRALSCPGQPGTLPVTTSAVEMGEEALPGQHPLPPYQQKKPLCGSFWVSQAPMSRPILPSMQAGRGPPPTAQGSLKAWKSPPFHQKRRSWEISFLFDKRMCSAVHSHWVLTVWALGPLPLTEAVVRVGTGRSLEAGMQYEHKLWWSPSLGTGGALPLLSPLGCAAVEGQVS